MSLDSATTPKTLAVANARRTIDAARTNGFTRPDGVVLAFGESGIEGTRSTTGESAKEVRGATDDEAFLLSELIHRSNDSRSIILALT